MDFAMIGDELNATNQLLDGGMSMLSGQQAIANRRAVLQEQSLDIAWNDKISDDIGQGQMGEVTPVLVTVDGLTSQGSKSRVPSRSGRGRGVKTRGGCSNVLPGSSHGKHSTASVLEIQSSNTASQQHRRQESGRLGQEVRNVNPLVTGSQSDPTLMTSLCRQEQKVMKQSHRPLADSCYQSAEGSSRQSIVTTEEKVMDAYIEKFSGGYNGGCMGVGNSLMPIRIDPTRRPSSLQEAICMYIDYLTFENEVRTRISECAIPSPPPPLDFHLEEYYREVMCRPVNFPTARFRDWLKLYNVDIEITDPDGQTVSQTTFTPAPPCVTVPCDKQRNVPAPLLSQHFSWQLEGNGSECSAAGRSRGLRTRSDLLSQSGLTPWIPDARSVGNTGTHQHHMAVPHIQSQYGLPSAPIETHDDDDQQLCVVTQELFSAGCSSTEIQQLQHTPFMRYNPGIIELNNQHRQLYVSDETGHHQQSVSGGVLNELTDLSMFAYGVTMKDEGELQLSNAAPEHRTASELPCTMEAMCSNNNFCINSVPCSAIDMLRSANNGERMKFVNYVMDNAKTPCHTAAIGQNETSQYQNEEKILDNFFPINPADQRSIHREDGVSQHTTSSIVDGCSGMGYNALGALQASTENNDTMNQLETDLIHISQLHDCNTRGNYHQMLVVPPSRSAAGSSMTNPSRPITSASNVLRVISSSGSESGNVTSMASVRAHNYPVESHYGSIMADNAVEWHQPVGVLHSSSREGELSTQCNNEVNFNGYNETAAAVAGLVFDELPHYRKNPESFGRRFWPNAPQWQPAASFSGGFDRSNSISLVEDEPLRKSAKFDDQDM